MCITMLYAVSLRMAEKAWKNGSWDTIVDRFISCGFSKNTPPDSSQQTEQMFVDPFSISKEEWHIIKKKLNINIDEISFQLFILMMT